MSSENNVFLLVPETFEELSEKTGLTIEQLRSMHSYDKAFGLTSKIYLIPAKVEMRDPVMKCRYEERYADQAGYIDVCIIHEEHTNRDKSEGPHRPCVKVDPFNG